MFGKIETPKDVKKVKYIYDYGFICAKPYFFTSRVAQTGKVAITVHFEGIKPKDSTENYVPNDNIKRPDDSTPEWTIGKAGLGIYFDWEDSDKKNEFLQNIVILADKAGVREELNKLPEINVLDDLLVALNKVFASANEIYVKFKAEEYQVGKFNYSLGARKSGDNFYVIAVSKDSVVDTIEDKVGPKTIVSEIQYKNEEGKTYKYNFDSSYDLKLITTAPDVEVDEEEDDLPF